MVQPRLLAMHREIRQKDRAKCGAICKKLKRAGVNHLQNYDQSDFSLKEDRKTENAHCHDPDQQAVVKSKIYRDCKAAALADIHKPSGQIVMEVFRKYQNENGNFLTFKSYARRVLNAARQKQRPPPPRQDDINFAIDTEYRSMPGFYRATVVVDNGAARHIIVFTQEQAELLITRKRWWLDGTFKIVKRPLYQLFSISGFVKNHQGNCFKRTTYVYYIYYLLLYLLLYLHNY